MEVNDEEQQYFLSKYIGSSLNTIIKFISSCYIRRKTLVKGDAVTAKIILIISKEKIYGFNFFLDKIKFEFPFDKINKLDIELLNEKSVFFDLADYKINEINIPSIVIYIENRETFLKLMSCYYCTYFSETYGLVKRLKIKTVDHFNYYNKKNVYKKISRIEHEPPDNYIIYEFYNYK